MTGRNRFVVILLGAFLSCPGKNSNRPGNGLQQGPIRPETAVKLNALRVAMCLLALLASSCGGSPVESEEVDLSGDWERTFITYYGCDSITDTTAAPVIEITLTEEDVEYIFVNCASYYLGPNTEIVFCSETEENGVYTFTIKTIYRSSIDVIIREVVRVVDTRNLPESWTVEVSTKRTIKPHNEEAYPPACEREVETFRKP